jgi:maltokinase
MNDAAALVAGLDLHAARWYAGKARRELRRRVVDDAPIGSHARGRLILFAVAYADGGEELYTLPAVDDGVLREAVAGDGVYAALAGEPGAERPLGHDQTNTSVIAGDAVVKVYRRVEAGPNPELEILEALAAVGFEGVPQLRCAVRREAPGVGTVDAAISQDYVDGAADGWESLIAPLEATLRGERADLDRLDLELRRIGTAAGRLHAALAGVFGLAPAGDDLRRSWRAEGRAGLAAALAEVPADFAAELGAHAAAIAAELDGLDRGPAPPVTRVHGDLHAAQFLRTATSVLAIDFEGEPTRPLAERRRPGSPLRDLACLVRSLDHIARTAEARAGAEGIEAAAAIDAWISAAQETVLAAYAPPAAAAGIPLDRALVRRFCLEKELYECAYAARVLPEWLYAPRLGMRWLMRDDARL